MNAMTCAEVHEQIDLLAADACDPPARASLEAHLRDCATCSARYAESKRLLGLLDLQWNNQGIARLQQKIDQLARPPRRLTRPLLSRVLAVAAMFLIAIGLIWWLPRWSDDQRVSEPAFALLVHARKQAPVPGPEKLPARFNDKSAEALQVIPLAQIRGKQYRDDLLKAHRDGKLPPPPSIALDLVLVNTGERAVEVRLGEATPTLELDLPADGVVRLQGPATPEPDFLRPQTLQLEPGKQHLIHVDRLIAGSRGKLEYIYVTEPGETTLTARVHLLVEGKTMTVTGQPVRIKIGD
jgi:hypothetical protein